MFPPRPGLCVCVYARALILLLPYQHFCYGHQSYYYETHTPYKMEVFLPWLKLNVCLCVMKQFIYAEPYRGDVEQALNDVWRYMIKGTYDLAGFRGVSVALSLSFIRFLMEEL